jgi:hypothetical protein
MKRERQKISYLSFIAAALIPHPFADPLSACCLKLLPISFVKNH